MRGVGEGVVEIAVVMVKQQLSVRSTVNTSPADNITNPAARYAWSMEGWTHCFTRGMRLYIQKNKKSTHTHKIGIMFRDAFCVFAFRSR